jgi:uncharacterized membrane protein YgaE (UPF0421/DUF939 family)
MVLFLLFGQVPIVLLVTLLIALYLTVIELRPLPLTRTVKVWWFLLVVLTHFIGYLALRAYVARRRPA